MDILKFKAGNYIQQRGYKSFIPEKINHEWIISDPKLNNLLSEASRCLGKLDMFSEYIPSIDMFIQMHVTKEATQSSKIEGTKTNIEDAFLKEENIDPEKRDDWLEVQNYIKAMNEAIHLMESTTIQASLPLSNRLIKKTHKLLLQGARGKHKLPGEFRNSQNWIGGATLKDATFIPPPHTEVPDLMSDLEKFFHNEEMLVPHLLKSAIVHYQFETIHPFLDGNGRIGRLLITLYLVHSGLLKKPVLYLSDFFEKNRQIYYDNLMNARMKNDLIQWLKFYLIGIIETSTNSIATFNKILKLKDRHEQQILLLGTKARRAKFLLDFLFEKPIIEAQDVSDNLGISMPTAYKFIAEFMHLGILKDRTNFQRNRSWEFNEYLNLFK